MIDPPFTSASPDRNSHPQEASGRGEGGVAVDSKRRRDRVFRSMADKPLDSPDVSQLGLRALW
eukprot:1158050-Pelagomonas_calceolata.AAC.8